MNGNMGLLSDFQGGAPAAPSGMGGLLGDMGGMPQQALQAAKPQIPQEDKNLAVQMATELSKNPTPQVAQQIIQRLGQMQSKEASQLAQVLTQSIQDPNALKGIADSVLQSLQ